MHDVPAKVLVQTGTYRSWRTLWRERPRWEVVFAGYIEEGEVHSQLNAPARARFVMEDALARLERRQTK